MYLLDTDYLINFLKGRVVFTESLFSTFPKELYTSAINVAEVLDGIYNYTDKKALKDFQNLLKTVKIIDINYQIASVYSIEKIKLRKVGKLIENFDLLIASTCIANNLILVTGNKKHFERIKNLKIYNINQRTAKNKN